jgi:hypothetical protein
VKVSVEITWAKTTVEVEVPDGESPDSWLDSNDEWLDNAERQVAPDVKEWNRIA